MVTERLDFPFAATRRYGAEPLTLAFDILTLPFQISNMLTGVPPLDIPNFGPVATGPTPTPTTYPTPTPAPSPTGGGGIAGDFGVVGLAAFPNGMITMPGELGYQSIAVGGQTFSAARVNWSGQVTNTGNTPISGLKVELLTIGGPGTFVIRTNTVLFGDLLPGRTIPVSISVDVVASDPPGDFTADASFRDQSNLHLGVKRSGVLGTIAPTTEISITGGFVV
jgi:hypothetical protein